MPRIHGITIFVKPQSEPCAEFCRRYVEAINRNYENVPPLEAVRLTENGSVELQPFQETELVDAEILGANAVGFRDGWQAAMAFLGRSDQFDSAYTSWMFSQGNPERKVLQ
jgi:hypothetical protein